MTEEYLTYGHRLEQYIADTARARAGTLLDDGGIVLFEGAQGDAARHRPRHVSVRHVVEPGRRRGLHRRRRRPEGHRRGLGHRQGLRHARRRRPVPDRARRRARRRASASAAASSARRPGAPRRIGWLDLVALRYAARINSLTALGDHQARRAHRLRHASRSARATAAPRRRRSTTSPTTRRCCTTRAASTIELPGWNEDITECRSERDLPAGRARLPALHRGLHRRADRAHRRRPRPRPDHLDRRAARRDRGVDPTEIRLITPCTGMSSSGMNSGVNGSRPPFTARAGPLIPSSVPPSRRMVDCPADRLPRSSAGHVRPSRRLGGVEPVACSLRSSRPPLRFRLRRAQRALVRVLSGERHGAAPTT